MRRLAIAVAAVIVGSLVAPIAGAEAPALVRRYFEQKLAEKIAAAIAETIDQRVDYGPVESIGTARAAAPIAPLLEEGKRRRLHAPRPRRATAAT